MLFLSGTSLPDTGRRVGEVGVVWVLVLTAVSTAVLAVVLGVAVVLSVAVLTVSC